MANLFERRDLFIGNKLKEFCAVTVTLKRGVNQTAGVSASVDAGEYEMMDGSGLVDRWRTRDFKILKADYIISGVVTLPQRGDIIIETLDGTQYQRVVDTPPGMPHYSVDQNDYMLNVHCKDREPE